MTKLTLPTLGNCVEKWRHRENQRTSILATDPETGEQENIQVPSWLFRGESADYPNTYSSMHRFSLSQLNPNARDEIVAVTKRLDSVLLGYGMAPMYSAALLQHYGLPTELIDVTSSLDAAAAFAAHGNSGAGLLMAFPTEEIAKHAILIDLKRIHFARRPRHQAAFAFFHREEPNLKNHELFKSLSAERMVFQGTEQELRQWDEHYTLICGAPHTDATSGLLNKLVEDVVLTHPESGKPYTICEEAQSWLDERIPWAPVPMRAVRGEPSAMEPAWEKF